MGILTTDLLGSVLKAAAKSGVRQGALSIIKGQQKLSYSDAAELERHVDAALDPSQPERLEVL